MNVDFENIVIQGSITDNKQTIHLLIFDILVSNTISKISLFYTSVVIYFFVVVQLGILHNNHLNKSNGLRCKEFASLLRTRHDLCHFYKQLTK